MRASGAEAGILPGAHQGDSAAVGLRVKQASTGIWQITGTVAGVRIRESARTRDRKLAEEKAAAIEAEVYREGERQYHYTFEQAVISYAEDGGEVRFLAPALEYFAGWLLRRITLGEIRTAARDLYHRPSYLPTIR